MNEKMLEMTRAFAKLRPESGANLLDATLSMIVHGKCKDGVWTISHAAEGSEIVVEVTMDNGMVSNWRIGKKDAFGELTPVEDSSKPVEPRIQ